MKATYIAPPGDSKVCEMAGYTFFDGIPVEVDDSSLIAGKLKTNQHFSIAKTRAPKAEKVEEPVEDHDKDAGKVADEPDLFKYPEPARRRRGGK